MSLNDALAYVKSCRSCIKPNHGFMSQLKAYEGILKARYIQYTVREVASGKESVKMIKFYLS